VRQDVLDALSGRFPRRIPTKETLNHPRLVTEVSGVDVFTDTPRAFALAWERLGIDIHAEVTENAPPPRVPGGTWVEAGTRYADLGVFPTSMPVEHLPGYDLSDPESVYSYDPGRDDIRVEEQARALRRANADFRARHGERAVHYHLYYTTLFMWAVVTFGWEAFMTAAALDPERFDRAFWQPWAETSRRHVEALCCMDEEVLFVHDDIAVSTGPVFAPAFYERFIFSRYGHILEPVRRAGKKLVFVSDGNIDMFLERLLSFPIDAVMYENPATPLARVLETWGRAGRGFIGGIDTFLLTHGTPDAVRAHTRQVIAEGRQYPGFILASCGGLHGNIPYENLRAYVAARAEAGIAPALA
jgi:hypothetical protein